MAISPISTTARSLYTHAAVFDDAARAVRDAVKVDPLPKYFLWSRTIELFLKSYLLAEGVSATELKSWKYGHDLLKLYNEARRRGIDILIGTSREDTAIVRILNLDYFSKRFEYRISGHRYTLPDPSLTQRLIKRLRRGVQLHLQQKYDRFGT